MDYYKIKIRQDTLANWETNEPVLASGEIAFVIDENKIKVGDGVSIFSDLDFLDVPDEVYALINNKVDKIEGKGLSTNDYTTADKNKLEGIQAGAEVNVQPNWNELDNTADSYIQNKPLVPSKTSDLENDSGFITGYTETDPIFTNSPAHDITSQDIENWNNKSDFSGSYNDLTDKPFIPTKTSDITNDSGFIDNTVSDLTNYTKTEDLASVATSGSYNDLSDTPTIPTTTSELTNDSGYIDKTVNNLDNYTPTSDLANVATSGSYNDLSDTPTIPNDYVSFLPQTLTEDQKGQVRSNIGAGASSFSGDYNDLSNKPTIPSKTSDLTNDSGFIDKTVNNLDNYTKTSDLSTVATSGSYNDLTDKPTIPTVNDSTIIINQGNVEKGRFTLNQSTNTTIDLSQGIASVDWSDVNNKPDFATVATSGDYNDLSNKPVIPASQIQSDWDQTDSTALDFIKNKPTIEAQKQADWGQVDDTSADYIKNKPTIPTKTSDLSNDSGFIDAGVSNLANYTPTTSLANVATSGDYGDLINVPTIPQVTNTITSGSNDAITSGAVYDAIGNIESLLAAI